MTVWLLVITVYFTNLTSGKVLDLPSDTVFLSADRCQIAGRYLADVLTQDGAEVEWKCVEIGQ